MSKAIAARNTRPGAQYHLTNPELEGHNADVFLRVSRGLTGHEVVGFQGLGARTGWATAHPDSPVWPVEGNPEHD